MSAPSAQRVAGGRWAVKYVCIPIVKSRKNPGQSAASLPTPGNVLRRAVRNLKRILRLLLPLS